VRHLPLVSLLVAPCALAAQTPASIRDAVESITPADVQTRIGILADDSMLGRATPSPQLELVASYIAREFRRLGLTPGGDKGTYLQRYPIERFELVAESSFVSLAGPVAATWRLGKEVLLLGGGPPPEQITGPAVFVTGTPAPGGGGGGGGAIDPAAISGKVVFLLIDRGQTPLARQVARLHAMAIVGISPIADSLWSLIASRQSGVITSNPSQSALGAPAFRTREATARVFFARVGIDLDSARAAMAAPVVVRALPGVSVRIAVRQRVLDRASAPNVIGILEGSDPRLRSEYLFFTGHMDHIGTPGAGEGCSARGGDSICNGADDDASGTTAVIEAAAAFSRLAPRPRRSLVFMTVSGEERGLWGSQYFSEHPTVPLEDVVADLNIDMIGRNWKDTIVAIGKEHSDLGATLNRVGAAHPELHMTPIDDIWPQENFYFRSDHYNFARKGVPILFFFNGTHPDYHQVGDSPDRIDAEKESRIIKLVFYLGLDIANAAERPKWNPESYKRIVGP